ncbi:MAG: 4Fe-4S binding protein [Oligoflexales bacterium]|nr:4Fe-4S binding protein [Oligoflexales bacterium]
MMRYISIIKKIANWILPNFANDENDVYRQLQRHIDSFPVGFPATPGSMEIEILKDLYTPDEARLAQCIPFVPVPIKTIKRKIRRRGLSADNIENFLEDLYKRGLAYRNIINGKICYSLAQFVVGFYDYQVDRMSVSFAKNTIKYIKDGAIARELARTGIPQMRTIPINQSLTPENRVATYDMAEEMIARKEGLFAVANCVCRQAAELAGEPGTHRHASETCLFFGAIAQHWIDMGRARQIDKEESLRILKEAQQAGAVLQPTNTIDPDGICCCCSCCCGFLKAARQLPKPAESFANNFFAAIEKAKCNDCSLCAKKCPMEAIILSGERHEVNLDRCIGCGACVPSCKKGAIKMREKKHHLVPYQDYTALFTAIMQKKSGTIGLLKMLFKSRF